jgi:hypothetical protein
MSGKSRSTILFLLLTFIILLHPLFPLCTVRVERLTRRPVQEEEED